MFLLHFSLTKTCLNNAADTLVFESMFIPIFTLNDFLIPSNYYGTRPATIIFLLFVSVCKLFGKNLFRAICKPSKISY